MAISTLQLSLVIFVCFTYSHLSHSRIEALCVALQAFKWQVLNEEMNTGVITKSVIHQLAFKSAYKSHS